MGICTPYCNHRQPSVLYSGVIFWYADAMRLLLLTLPMPGSLLIWTRLFRWCLLWLLLWYFTCSVPVILNGATWHESSVFVPNVAPPCFVNAAIHEHITVSNATVKHEKIELLSPIAGLFQHKFRRVSGNTFAISKAVVRAKKLGELSYMNTPRGDR